MSLKFYRAQKEHFERLFEIMDNSFPDNEMRTKEKLYEMFTQNEHYRIYCAGNETNAVLSSIIVWDLGKFIFLENFATDKKIRGQGVGGDLLDYVIKLYNKDVILEVELPENQLTRRRIKFYERHGFIYNDFEYLMPPLRDGDSYFPLKIMSYNKTFTKQEFEEYKDLIYKIAYQV